MAFLAERPAGAADLAVAADALVYLGDLQAGLRRGRARRWRPAGLFAFTIESGEAPFALGPALRFRHSDAHLREAAGAAGLTVVHARAGLDASARRGRGAGAGRSAGKG